MYIIPQKIIFLSKLYNKLQIVFQTRIEHFYKLMHRLQRFLDTHTSSFIPNLKTSELKEANCTETSLKHTTINKNQKVPNKKQFFSAAKNGQKPNEIPTCKNLKNNTTLFSDNQDSIYSNTLIAEIKVPEQIYSLVTKQSSQIKAKTEASLNQEKFKRIIQLFSLLDGKIKNNSDEFMKNIQCKQRTKQALKNICNNLQRNMSTLFNTWRRNSAVLKNQYQSKQKVVSSVVFTQQYSLDGNLSSQFQRFNCNKLQHSQQLDKSKEANLWKKRSIDVIALNTKITTQNSIWRLNHLRRYLEEQSRLTIYKNQKKTLYNFKVKKMFNNLCKIYRVNLFKGFLAIQSDKQYFVSKASRIQSIDNSKFTVCDSDNSLFLSLRTADHPTKHIACQMMHRIFNKNFNKQIKKWYYRTIPLSLKMSLLSQQNQKKTVFDYKVHLIIVKMTKISKLNLLRNNEEIKQAFELLKLNFLHQKMNEKEEYFINEQLTNIKQKQLLMEQLQQQRELNEYLSQQVKVRDNNMEYLIGKIAILESQSRNFQIKKVGSKIMGIVFKRIAYNNIRDCFYKLLNHQKQRNHQESLLLDLSKYSE